MVFDLLSKDIETLTCPALVVFSKASSQKDKSAKITHSELNKKLTRAIDDKTITGKLSETIVYRELNYKNFRHVLVVGLGKENDMNPESIRQAMAAASEAIKSAGIKEAAIHFDGVSSNKKDLNELAQAAAEGLGLSSYSMNELKSKKTSGKESKEEETTLHLVTNTNDKTFKTAFSDGVMLASCVNFSRRLGDLPGNLMTPTILANSAADAAKGTGIKVTIWDKARIKKERMGGLLG
ncbi:MAG: aminopeptidase, partial [Proteobacteria bacterium]